MPVSEFLLDQPLASVEFLAVDTETNGLPRERCELTEVGAVLVGGGELHDTWTSLVAVSRPLSRGIQRFTGISQAMLDGAPLPEEVLPELAVQLRGRVMVAHSASFDTGVLRQAFARAGLDWPDPPVICTVALARRLAPLHQRRALGEIAAALGIEVEHVHRALPDAETCGRVFAALFPRLCAHAETVRDALALLKARNRNVRRPSERASRRRAPEERPDLAPLPQDPGIYIFRDGDGRPLYVGKSVRIRDRARSHFASDAGWTARAAHVEHLPTESELGALVLECRTVRALRPPGNKLLKREPDGLHYIRCRLDIPFPILELAREPASGCGVTFGPLRGRAAASELVEQLNSLFSLRHCGRGLPRRESPSAYGQMGRCLSPCLGDLDPNLYRERLDRALAILGAADDGSALLEHVRTEMVRASAARRYERAAWLRRRHQRLGELLARLGGVLRRTGDGAQLVLAPHPADAVRFDAFHIAAGRIHSWGPLPYVVEETIESCAAATRAAAVRDGWLPASEVDEARIVGAWIDANRPPVLELGRATDPDRIRRFVEAAAPVARRSERQLDDRRPDPVGAGGELVARSRLAAHERKADRPMQGTFDY